MERENTMINKSGDDNEAGRCKTCNINMTTNILSNYQIKYCSPKCRSIGKSINMKGKNIRPRPDIVGKNNPNFGGKYNVIKRPIIEKCCEYCKTKFSVKFVPDRPQRFCSVGCMALGNVGAAHKNWRGNRSARRSAMSRLPYRNWRDAVFVRDDYTCVICSARGGNLNADHIMPWALYESLRYDVSNGRTLCVPCHKKTDTYGRMNK